jgi:hypothetical protein
MAEATMGEKGAESTATGVAGSGLSLLDPLGIAAQIGDQIRAAELGGAVAPTTGATAPTGELGAEFDATSLAPGTSGAGVVSGAAASPMSDIGSLSPDAPTLSQK